MTPIRRPEVPVPPAWAASPDNPGAGVLAAVGSDGTTGTRGAGAYPLDDPDLGSAGTGTTAIRRWLRPLRVIAEPASTAALLPPGSHTQIAVQDPRT
jgi:hypothetical protein